jgi:uncharacterized membrane protein
MVAAIILIALGVSVSVAAAQFMNKQWMNTSRIYDLDTASSYIRLKKDGTAAIMIALQNVGTTTAYVQKITIEDRSIEVFFVNQKAYVTFWSTGQSFEGTVSFSSSKAAVQSAWLLIPPGEAAYLAFTATGVGSVLSVGASYPATIYALAEGKVLTFRLVVESS